MARYGRLLTDAQWEKIRPWLPKRPHLTNARCPPVSFCRPIRNDVSNIETEACSRLTPSQEFWIPERNSSSLAKTSRRRFRMG
jgi:hypothetical protein